MLNLGDCNAGADGPGNTGKSASDHYEYPLSNEQTTPCSQQDVYM